MELEMENGEEQEKQTTKRRSSILKMPKVRNPFEEIEITETFTDISVSKPVRRVSFASSNYIKPFVADPEKNTIWDTTYEEDVNHTNSTQSSHDQISSNCTKLGSTLGVSHEVAVDATSVFEQSMEFTKIVDKENFPLYANTKLSIVDYARKSNVSVFDASANMQKANGNGVSFNTTKSSMEFTCQNLNVFMKDDQKAWRQKSVHSDQEVEMADSENPETLNTSVMEFTCQIPRLEVNQQKPIPFKEHNDDNNMEFTCQISQNKLIGAENTMEFTCLQQSNLLKTKQDELHSTKYDLSKLNNTEFTCQIGSNLTTVSQSMELTYQQSNTSKYETLPVFKNQDQDFTMDFTCQVNAQKTNELEFTKCNLANLSQVVPIAHMTERNQSEINEGVESHCQNTSNKTNPVAIAVNGENTQDMEFTCHVQNNLTKEVNLEQHNLSKLIDVEFIRPVPERNITNTSEGMEFSCQIPQNETKLSKQMIHAKTSELINHDQVHENYILDSGQKIKSNIHSKIPIPSQVNSVQIENSRQVGSIFNRSETLTSHSKVNDRSASLQEKSYSDMEVEETYMTTTYPDSTKPGLPNLCINESTNQSKSGINFNQTMQSSKMSVQDTSTGANNLKLEKMSDKEKTLVDYILEDKENLPSDRNKIFSTVKTSLNGDTTNLLGNHENPQKVAKNPLALWKSETSIAKNESKPQRESELICTFPETQNSSPKTNPRKLHDLSDSAMGSFNMEPSFHINLTNISSGVDDTQHLLQCTYSKSNPVSLMKSRIEDKNASGFTLNLEETGHVSKPNLTGLTRLDDTKYSPDISLCRNKLSKVNDTYVLKNRKDTARNVMEEEVSCSNDDDEDTSLGLIPQDSIDRLYEGGIIKLPAKFELKEFKYDIQRISEVSDLLENIRKQKEHITNYLENFEFRPMRIPEFFLPNSRKSSSNRTSSSESSEDGISIVDSPTIEKKITDKQKNSQNCWKLEKVNEDIYHFSTLFGALRFVVNLDRESGRVFNIEASSKLAADSKLVAHYIMKLFLEKLDDNHIKSAIGDRYDILSLLDYVQMKMREFHHLQHDLVWRCRFLTMEENFVAKFTLLSVPLILSCQIFVNVSDPENLKYEDIKIMTRMGSVNENDIKNLARNCPKGLDFFTSFQKSLEKYLKVKEERMNV